MRARPIDLDWFELRDRVSYNRFTGNFKWTHDYRNRSHLRGQQMTNRATRPCAAYRETRTGDCTYYMVTYKGRKYMAHRFAWFWMTRQDPPSIIHHIDSNRKNNKWSNLQASSDKHNRNPSAAHTPSTSKYCGVIGLPPAKKTGEKKWVARVYDRDKTITVGVYNNERDAGIASARARAAKYGPANIPEDLKELLFECGDYDVLELRPDLIRGTHA